MIFGNGVDILYKSRVEKILSENCQLFLNRILSEDEKEFYQFYNKDFAFFSKKEIAKVAKIFSAKESIAKALGTGFRNGVSLKDFSVLNDDMGKPIVKITQGSAAEKLLEDIDNYNILLSVSDESDLVISYCIIDAE